MSDSREMAVVKTQRGLALMEEAKKTETVGCHRGLGEWETVQTSCRVQRRMLVAFVGPSSGLGPALDHQRK